MRQAIQLDDKEQALMQSQQAMTAQPQQDRVKDMLAGNSPQAVASILQRENEKEQAEGEKQSRMPTEFDSRLGAFVNKCWEKAYSAKSRHEVDLLRDLRQRDGIYEPEILAAIREMGGSEIYMMLTQVKCRALESWITEILFAQNEFPFEVEPTPIPELPADLQQEMRKRMRAKLAAEINMGIYPTPEEIQEATTRVYEHVMENMNRYAKTRAKRMNKKIQDIIIETGWFNELKAFISDFSTYRFACIKGPIKINKKKLAWGQDQLGRIVPVESKGVAYHYERVSPFDLYPSPSSRDLNDGYLIEVISFRRKSLYDLIGAPGYDEAAIRTVINRFGDRGYRINRAFQTQRDWAEGRHNEYFDDTDIIEAYNFSGSVRGKLLLDWGMTPDMVPDPDDDYEANVIMIDNEVIRAVLNPHPLGHRPYHWESFERINGQIYGKGPPALIADLQQMCNSCARALANNMALASGPMAEIMVDLLADGETTANMRPWRQFQTREPRHSRSGNRGAINFFQPNSNASELIGVYEFFSKLSDEYTAIPAYAHGQNVSGGAASTASGLSMLQENAARGVKRAVKAIDRVIEGSIRMLFEDLMLNDPDEKIKGDLKVNAVASTAMVNKERQAMRQNNLLQTVTNPMDHQIIGMQGRAEMLRQLFRNNDIDSKGIIPTDSDIKKIMMQQQIAAQQEAMNEQDPDGNDRANNQVQPEAASV